jgi:hypothetical protein
MHATVRDEERGNPMLECPDDSEPEATAVFMVSVHTPWTQDTINRLRVANSITDEEFNELLLECIVAYQVDNQAAERRAEAMKAHGPDQPKRVENMGEWRAYREATYAHRLMVDKAKHAAEKAASWKDQLQAVFSHFFPTQVWFRCGPYGVGISYTNWGGNHSNLEVALWADEMPSLDRTYHGD